MGLTAINVENLKPKATDYRRSDAGGLYLLIRPNGSKLWRYDYRLDGIRRTLSIGEYDKDGDGKKSFTLKQARDVHEKAQADVKKGQHPASQTEKAVAKAAAETAEEDRKFGKLADAWLGTRKKGASAKTYARDERTVRYLKDGYRGGKGFGSLLVEDVKSSHLSDLIEKFNKPTRVRVIAAAKKIMGIAKRKGLIQHSPFSDVDFNEGFGKHKVTHRPAVTDEAEFGALLRKIDTFEGRGHNLTSYALKLLALTFVRPGTMAKAEWRHFDLEAARWVIPFANLKMEWLRSERGEAEDDFVVPLSRQAIAILRELRAITGEGRYLFPGSGDADVISENTINFALHALGYQGIHCAHGFRASASTILNRQRKDGRRRFETALIEIQQDRLDASTRAIYDRDDLMPERIDLMQFWADLIDEMRNPPKLRLVA